VIDVLLRRKEKVGKDAMSPLAERVAAAAELALASYPPGAGPLPCKTPYGRRSRRERTCHNSWRGGGAVHRSRPSTQPCKPAWKAAL